MHRVQGSALCKSGVSGNFGLRYSARTAREDHSRHGPQHDEDVPHEAGCAGIFYIKFDALFVGRVAAAFDLPQAGQARADSAVVPVELAIFCTSMYIKLKK